MCGTWFFKSNVQMKKKDNFNEIPNSNQIWAVYFACVYSNVDLD